MQQRKNESRLLAIDGNYAVVQVGGRNFPAAAIQGDSLKILQETLQELADSLDSGDIEEARFPLREAKETVDELLDLYEKTSRQLGFKLPYGT
ncbi:hypothetical protein AB0953_17965 [Streptomyces sp. NPDC046866]|uniref:DUF6959 family protein n=1 Tax=Streptomyces sp. NPDC046866 TaxID=3154921 RepID=UPI0034557E4E